VKRTAALAALCCGCTGADPSAPEGTDLFQIAFTEAPGGALLSVWVPPQGRRAYLVGGYVAVEPLATPDGLAGRLVGYEGGDFRTLCRTRTVLWWVQGIGAALWACGDDGAVLRYDPAAGRCEEVPLTGAWPAGRPTLWGLWGEREDEIYFVGGSPRPDGPRGVLLRYDGRAFLAVSVPEVAREVNLYKLARARDRTYVVGARDLVLVRDDGAETWRADPVPTILGAPTLFTASCARTGTLCAAVGGLSSARLLLRPGFNWVAGALPEELPGLNGVWVEHDASVFLVGQQGTTMHFNGRGYYLPPRALTPDALHAVGGNSEVVFAVGGEIGNARPDQRGTVLVRGEVRASYTLDGRSYRASGAPRPRLGDARGQ
jgi:hypothetical protein